jgi:hypothetical protein
VLAPVASPSCCCCACSCCFSFLLLLCLLMLLLLPSAVVGAVALMQLLPQHLHLLLFLLVMAF